MYDTVTLVTTSSSIPGLRAGGQGGGGGQAHERQRLLLRPGHQDRHPPDPKGWLN